MIILKKEILFTLLSIGIVLLSLSCESNFDDVQKNNLSSLLPSNDADEINLKYTDSGRITGTLVSPKMLDYVTQFPFTEFPKGICITLYDKNAKKTVITANMAVLYKQTGIIDLQGNVKMNSDEGHSLETQQLYYDEKNAWFFSEKKFKFSSLKGISNGQGIDFSKDFKTINSQRITGELNSVE